MAMRPRGGGAAAPRRGESSGAVRSVYEDFRPMAEWQQDEEFHILNIYLPGFMKEQIKVTIEGNNTISVRGERLVAGNKWSRFQEDFLVPENGELNSVRAKFQGGILNITVPKAKVDTPQHDLPPKTEGINDIQKQPTPQKGQENVPPEVSTSQTTGKRGTEPEKPSESTAKHRQENDEKHLTPQKGQDKAFSAVGIRQSAEEKSLEPHKPSSDPKKGHDQDGDQKGRSFTPLTRTAIPHNTEKKESSHSKEKRADLARPDDERKTTVDKEGKETIRSRESPDVETANKTKLEKDGATNIPEKNADNKESYGAFSKDKYKKKMKGLAVLNEERQLLVNMGVAMLVIVALTAYVTYNFASAKDKN